MWWAGIWVLLATAPTVRPDRCVFENIRSGLEECGGPCTREEAQP